MGGSPCASVVSGKLNTMKASERTKRDADVMRMFFAGASYRAIAQAVGLRSHVRVAQIVERELADTGDRRELVTDEAQTMWLERFERLWRANWPKALDGDRYATT